MSRGLRGEKTSQTPRFFMQINKKRNGVGNALPTRLARYDNLRLDIVFQLF